MQKIRKKQSCFSCIFANPLKIRCIWQLALTLTWPSLASCLAGVVALRVAGQIFASQIFCFVTLLGTTTISSRFLAVVAGRRRRDRSDHQNKLMSSRIAAWSSSRFCEMTGDHGSSTSRRVLHARWRGHVAARLSPVRPLYVHMASSGGDDLCPERLAGC